MEETTVGFENILEVAAEGAIANVLIHLLDALDVDITAEVADKVEAVSKRKTYELKQLITKLFTD